MFSDTTCGLWARASLIFLISLPVDAQNIDCIVELMVPRYNLSSRRAVGGGTVVARILIADDGRPSKIDIESADNNLADEVRAYLTNSTKYAASCAQKQIEIKFTYRLEGAPEYNPLVFVQFRPPNHFVITSRPLKPQVN